jgi:hypothetical protein
MGLIRKLAVRGYLKDVNRMIDVLSNGTTEQIGKTLMLSVWLRAGLELEGNLPAIESENGNFEPELHSYPITIGAIEKWMSICNKEGLQGSSFALSIWVHTLRSIIRPELSMLAKKMWDILMRSKPDWEMLLNNIRDEDLQKGISDDIVLKNERHARAILKCLPPKQLS